MMTFACSTTQAARAARALASHGTPRRDARGSPTITSIGTERTTAQSLAQVAYWMRAQGWRHGVAQITARQAYDYLRARAQVVAQATLDRERRALGRVIGRDLDRVMSARPAGRLATQQRHYTAEQIARIQSAQDARNALATRVAAAGGLRAAELLTIARADEAPLPVRPGRRADTFTGRDGVAYAVTGKGGLVRHVVLPRDVASALEARRLEAPRTVTDRGVHRVQRYDIAGGQAWSQSFAAASQRALGWSVGAHAVRHDYADQRLRELSALGHPERDAKAIIAQEVGHWSPRTTEAYMRRS